MNGKVVALAAMIMASQGAIAADSVDVKITGRIVPAPCSPTTTGGGIVDYGTIRADAIKKDQITLIGQKNLDFSITCPGPTRITLSVTDARAGTAAQTGSGDSVLLGLSTSGGKNIGAYGIDIKSDSVKLAGVTGATIMSKDGGTTWSNAYNTGGWGGTYLYSFKASTDAIPATFTTMTGTLNVNALIAKDLDLSKEITLDGLNTFTINYL